MLPDEPAFAGMTPRPDDEVMDSDFSAGTAESVLRRVHPLPADMPVSVFLERLHSDLRNERVFPVTRGEEPLGIVDRLVFLERMSGPYSHALHGRRSLSEFADPETPCFELGTPLERIVQVVTCNGDLLHLPPGRDGFLIVEDGCYRGVGFVLELLARITEQQMRQARHANPLTGLPGNGAIQKRLDGLLARGMPFRLGYFDLDSFKAFNDRYGHARGDAMILELSRVLMETLDPSPGDRDVFLGHVGGDDFVAILPWSRDDGIWQQVLDAFAAAVPGLYDPEDLSAGGILGKDRQGREVFHPLASLSIGVVPCPAGAFAHSREVAQRAAEVKAQAKRISGNSWFEDRRTGG